MYKVEDELSSMLSFLMFLLVQQGQKIYNFEDRIVIENDIVIDKCNLKRGYLLEMFQGY